MTLKKYLRIGLYASLILLAAYGLAAWAAYLALGNRDIEQSYVAVDAIERAYGAKRLDSLKPLPRSELPSAVAALCFDDGFGPDAPCRLAEVPLGESCRPLIPILAWRCASVMLSPAFHAAPDEIDRVKAILRDPCVHIFYVRTDAPLTPPHDFERSVLGRVWDDLRRAEDLRWRREFCPTPPPLAYRLQTQANGRTVVLGIVKPGPQ